MIPCFFYSSNITQQNFINILVPQYAINTHEKLEHHKYFSMEREEQQKTKLAAIQDRLEIEENLSRQRNYKTLQKIEQLSTGLNRRILLLEEYNEDHKEQNWEVFFRYLTYVLLLCSNIFTILYNQYPDSKTLAWTASGALIGLSLMTAIEILRPIIKYCFKGCKKRTDRIANRQGSGQQLTNRRLVQPNNRA